MPDRTELGGDRATLVKPTTPTTHPCLARYQTIERGPKVPTELLILIAAVAGFILFDVAAMHLGADSRVLSDVQPYSLP
jgi:hypothetical protein